VSEEKFSSAPILASSLGDPVTKNLIKVSEMTEPANIVPAKVAENFIIQSVERDFTVDANALVDGNSFMCSLEFKDNKGVTIDEKRYNMSLEETLRQFTYVKSKPSAEAKISDSIRNISFSCTQNDMNGESIRIYKRIYQRNRLYSGNTDDQSYNLVKTVKLSQGQTYSGKLKSAVTDQGDIIILRFVAISILGRPGAFRDVVVVPKLPDLNLPDKKNPKIASFGGHLSYECNQKGVRLRAYNIRAYGSMPSLVILKSVYSKSVTGKPTLINSYRIPLSKGTELLDVDVKNGKYYEYKLGVLSLGKNTIITSPESRIFFQYNDVPTFIKPHVSMVTAARSKNKKVVFNLDAKIIQKDVDLLFSFIKSLDLEEIYEDDINEIKSKLNQFFVYRVTRKDLSSNKLVDLGFHNLGVFNDDCPSSNVLGMKHNAIYTFELYGGTIKDALASLKSGALLNIPLYLQSKFYQQMGLYLMLAQGHLFLK